MDFTFNIRTDSNADLPRQLLVNSVNKQELRIQMYNYVKLVQHLIMSSIQVSTYARYSRRLASFSMQWVWLCLLFTISCFSAGLALKTIYYFLTQKQTRIPPKIVSVHLSHSDLRKLLDFCNTWIRTLSHPYWQHPAMAHRVMFAVPGTTR